MKKDTGLRLSLNIKKIRRYHFVDMRMKYAYDDRKKVLIDIERTVEKVTR